MGEHEQTKSHAKKPRKERKKLADAETSGSTATGSRRRRRRNQSANENNNLVEKLIVVGLIAACIIAGGVFASVILMKETSKDISCEVVSASVTYKKPSSPLDVNNCNDQLCSFDTNKCVEICPMGHTSDINGCPIACTCAPEGLFEGDIQFDYDSLPHMIKSYEYVDPFDTAFDLRDISTDTQKYLWPIRYNGKVKVPYLLHKDLENDIDEVITKVSTLLTKKTCIELYPIGDSQKNEIFHLNITTGRGCGSTIGYQGNVKEYEMSQELVLGEGCIKFEIVLHGILHSLGLFHEHTRPDRDAYIEILWGNVLLVKKQSFQKRSASLDNDDNFEYDLNSLLHYTSDLYTTGGDLSSFVDVKNREPHNIRAITASNTDLAKINDLYLCEKNTDKGQWTEWSEWTICDRTCGYGAKFRWRKCLTLFGDYTSSCIGLKNERLVCGTDKCPGEFSLWGLWGQCSLTCGSTGVQKRDRDCTVYGGCDPNIWAYVSTRECNRKSCQEESGQITYEWSPWREWEICESRSCNDFMKRNRTCVDSILIFSIQCEQDNEDLEYIKSGEFRGTEIQAVPCCSLIDPSDVDDGNY